MKRKLFTLAVALLLVLTLAAPALAYSEYGGVYNYITDAAGLLTESEWETLERNAQSISEEYDFGVYIITLDDYTIYTDGNVTNAAEAFYQAYDLGTGGDRNGILLLLSMEDRDYSLITEGQFGNYAFNTDGREALTEVFLDDFGDDDWYEGFSDYLTWCEKYLEAAQNAEPFSGDNPPMGAAGKTRGILIRVAAILLIPLIVAFVVILILVSQLKSVAASVEAANYIQGDLILTEKQDQFTHSTRTQVKIKTETSKSSSSSSSTSGKF